MKVEYKGYFFIIISDTIVRRLGRLISLGDNAMAITVFPFIFVRRITRPNKELIRHETIHIRQQLELLLVGAIMLYLYEFLYAKFVKKLDARQVYYYSAMEQEAHRNARNEQYLKTRKPLTVLKYIFNKKQLRRGPNDELIQEEY
ncbi:MAG: hypothetical protein ABIO57_02590 [Candidatus Paceibacterota bacterium]